MTDSVVFFQQVIGSCSQFLSAAERIRTLADRIAADSSLAAAAAAAAATGGRPDLVTADFDNFKATADAINSLLNAAGTGSVNTSVNAATVKLPLYKML